MTMSTSPRPRRAPAVASGRRSAARSVGAGRGARAAGIATGADHASGAEQRGDLDRHRAGVAGRAEDQDALARLDRDTAPQRHPRRHRRVHRGGDRRGVGAVRSSTVRRRSTIALSAIVPETSSPADEVDRRRPGAGRPRRCRGSSAARRCSCSAPRPRRCGPAGAGRRRGRRPGLVARRRGALQLLIVRWLVEGGDDRGVHHGHAGVPPETGRSDLVGVTY